MTGGGWINGVCLGWSVEQACQLGGFVVEPRDPEDFVDPDIDCVYLRRFSPEVTATAADGVVWSAMFYEVFIAGVHNLIGMSVESAFEVVGEPISAELGEGTEIFIISEGFELWAVDRVVESVQIADIELVGDE